VQHAHIGVFGGSGFYSLLDDMTTMTLDTPYGATSAPLTVGRLAGVDVAFMPRHGVRHELLPHQIPVRANLWALRTLGVRRVIGPCAVGSLDPAIRPEDFVVLDQFVDMTHGREVTFYDQGVAHHLSVADPYCPELRRVALDAGEACGITMHATGTVVVIQGPRFATRAESRAFRAAGHDVVNMTQCPEAYLARELGMCYCGLALVTDYDAGIEDDPSVAPVTQEQVFAVMERNVTRVRALLAAMAPAADQPAACRCRAAVGPLPG
jgi:5'-methylthioadenosine phosphorylase